MLTVVLTTSKTRPSSPELWSNKALVKTCPCHGCTFLARVVLELRQSGLRGGCEVFKRRQYKVRSSRLRIETCSEADIPDACSRAQGKGKQPRPTLAVERGSTVQDRLTHTHKGVISLISFSFISFHFIPSRIPTRVGSAEPWIRDGCMTLYSYRRI